jgi:hypothetical protein
MRHARRAFATLTGFATGFMPQLRLPTRNLCPIRHLSGISGGTQHPPHLDERRRATGLAVSGICGSRGSPGSCHRGLGLLAQPLTEVAAVTEVADPTSFLT